MQSDPAVSARDSRFVAFIRECETVVREFDNENQVRSRVAALATELAADWTMPDAQYRRLQDGAPYSSYQLYLNRARTLSVILDIFAPGQVAPVHNHQCWGVFVCLEGRELERHYDVAADLSAEPVEAGVCINGPGQVSVASSAVNAFHQVECLGDQPAVSLHVYGADLKQLQRLRWDHGSRTYLTFCSASGSRPDQPPHYLTEDGLATLR